MIFHEFTVQVFLNKVNEAININSIIRKKNLTYTNQIIIKFQHKFILNLIKWIAVSKIIINLTPFTIFLN